MTRVSAPWDSATAQRFVTADGTALHVVQDTNPADAPLTVVLLHGWTLDHHSWDEVARLLPQRTGPIRLLRYDHRGHGGSAAAPPGTATIQQCAHDLAELLADRVPTGPIVLVGHSMGGMAVMALAEEHPEVLDRVVAVGLVATSCGELSQLTLGLPKAVAKVVLGGEALVNKGLARDRRPALLPTGRPLRLGLRWLLFGKRPRRADVAATADQVARCNPANMAGFRTSLNEHDRKEALARLRGRPVVLLAGDADRLTPLPHARAIAAELHAAEFVIYPGAGHMLPYERADEVIDQLAGLIRSVKGARA